MNSKNNNEKIPKEFGVIADPVKSVPKFVSNINFSVTSEGGVVMTLLGESPGAKEKVLIETIYLEGKHAREAADLLLSKITKNE